MSGSGPHGFGDPDHREPQTPVDYPGDASLPPPLYPAAGYPPAPPAAGYYPPPGYGFDPYRPLRPPGTNGMAIAALVSSLLGVACCGFSAVPGVILGVMAMRETKRTGQDGWGIALAGTVIGGLFIAGLLVTLLLYIGLWSSQWQWT
ncbi:DUF4190 domain-containing protein [Mycobacterium sp. IDR2000157661]|uniref:DUF4190 domain-containing protein n=1 Tax=Mycobacterium sp. IDR2000157661 TaxID=2867005 RepID=UPI001EEC0CF1|nr:DUF4190 domain-containing protein [Mycobacterium sp. IDR2000157661]ULE31506.1 DUF4190 domain-containing protein [Mycobacterium sp. IDR2000157661]